MDRREALKMSVLASIGLAAAAAGLAAGVLRMFGGRPSLATLAPQASARLAGIAAAGVALFVLVASVMVLRSNLILLE